MYMVEYIALVVSDYKHFLDWTYWGQLFKVSEPRVVVHAFSPSMRSRSRQISLNSRPVGAK